MSVTTVTIEAIENTPLFAVKSDSDTLITGLEGNAAIRFAAEYFLRLRNDGFRVQLYAPGVLTKTMLGDGPGLIGLLNLL
jgi:hypothetical protein